MVLKYTKGLRRSRSRRLYCFIRLAESRVSLPVDRSVALVTCLAWWRAELRRKIDCRSLWDGQQQLQNVGKFRPRNFRAPLHHHPPPQIFMNSSSDHSAPGSLLSLRMMKITRKTFCVNSVFYPRRIAVINTTCLWNIATSAAGCHCLFDAHMCETVHCVQSELNVSLTESTLCTVPVNCFWQTVHCVQSQ
jgi:hypothetical protein